MPETLLRELGAALCHQRADRLLAPGAVLCARCSGLYLSFGLAVLGALAAQAPPLSQPRRLPAAVGGGLLLLLVVAHVLLRRQAASSAERLAVGALGGVGLAWLLAVPAQPHLGEPPSGLQLPRALLGSAGAVVLLAAVPSAIAARLLSAAALVSAAGLYVTLNWLVVGAALHLLGTQPQDPLAPGRPPRGGGRQIALRWSLAFVLAALQWGALWWFKAG